MAGEMAEHIGRRIRQARRELGLNQRELADRIPEPAVDNQRISDWERGVNKPSERYMALLATALDREVSWFFAKDQTPTPDLFVIPGDGDKLDQILSELERAHDDREGMQKLIDQQSELLQRQEELLRKMDARLSALGPVIDAVAELLEQDAARRAEPRRRRGNGG